MPYKLTLKVRALIIFVTVFITMTLILMGILNYLFIDTFERLEISQMEKNLERIDRAITKEQNDLMTLAYDWAVWDDTYEFMGKNSKTYQNYISSNIDSDTLINLKINLIAYLNFDKSLHFATSHYQEKALADQAELTKFISEKIVHKLYKNDRKGAVSFVNYNKMKLIVSVSPILKSNKKGVSRGLLVMARVVDENYIAKISEQILIPLKMEKKIISEKTFTDDTINGHHTIKGIFNKTVLYLHTSSKTTFLSHGERFLITILTTVTILLLIFFKLMHSLIVRGIINRILMLETDLERIPINESKEVILKEDDVDDEVSHLRVAINKLLKKVCNKENELLQTSKLATVGTMVASFAHEINNPVFALKGSIQLMKLKLERSDSKEVLDIIGDQLVSADLGLERLAHIVGSLTSFVRANHGEKDQIDAHANIDKSLVLLDHVLMINNIKLVKSLDAENSMLFANAGQFQQVITNLITNAKDALADSHDSRIEIITKNHEKKFVVQVIDNGNGIEDTSKIFQTFYTTKAVGKGTGLGLGIVEQIISNLDGLIKVDSTLGEGTTFTITIPNSKILVNP